MSSQTSDFLIIGGGFAGISAAKKIAGVNQELLIGERPFTYTILEAQKEVGGRAQTQIMEGGVIINPGAQWLHRDVRPGSSENIMVKIANDLGIKLNRDSMPREFWSRGQQQKWSRHIQMIREARAMIDGFDRPYDISLAEYLAGLGAHSSIRMTFGEVETGAPLEQVSAIDVRELVACNMGDFTFEGVGELFKRYSEPVNQSIKTNSPVKRIKWQGVENDFYEVETTNGDLFRTKHLILTASVGVLKSGAIKFEPDLPEQTTRDLSNIYMGNFNKVFLRMHDDFRFPVNQNTHMDVHTRAGHDIFYLVRDNGQQLVTAFFGGEMALICDNDKEQALSLAKSGLEEVWKMDLTKAITSHFVTDWGKNEFVRGGYSRVAVGSHDVRQRLAEPIAGRLLLAGEGIGALAKDGRNWSTHMAGAILSGERAAEIAISRMKEARRSHIGRISLSQSGSPDYPS